MAPATRTTKSTKGSELGSAPGAEVPSQAGTCVSNSPSTVAPTLILQQVELMELQTRVIQAEARRMAAEADCAEAEARL
ncbi:hypothetical protein E4U61_001161 [Claviceps capensis]|nr:hypothetical protein E4U61_001161 [Claviceps capensis]